MISRAQQILIKRAQKEAALSDTDYRDALEAVSGRRSTKDPRLTDRHVDLFLAYVEAIHWREIDKGLIQPSPRPDAVFRQRGYWAGKNPGAETSRDRYMAAHPLGEIERLESALAELGCGREYFAAIRRTVMQGRSDARAFYNYQAALRRTLKAKQRAQAKTFDRELNPF